MHKTLIYSPLTNGAMLHHLKAFISQLPDARIFCAHSEDVSLSSSINVTSFNKGGLLNKLFWLFSPFFAKKIMNEAKKHSCSNILIINGEFSVHILFLIVYARFNAVKVSIIWHDVTPHVGSFKNYILWFFSLINCCFCHVVVTHNKRYHNSLSKWLIGKTVKYLPFPLYDFLLNDLKQNPVKEDCFLFLGRLERYKGIGRILEFAKKMPLLNFRIVGTGSDTIRKEIEQEKLKNLHVVSMFVSDVEMIQEIAKAKCLILPYLHGSQSSLPFIAAMLNCPLITSDNVGFKDDVYFVGGAVLNMDSIDQFSRAANSLTKTHIDIVEYHSSFQHALRGII